MRWKPPITPDWEVWFAWHPVLVGATWVWLEKVDRMYFNENDGCGADGYYEYRNINEV